MRSLGGSERRFAVSQRTAAHRDRGTTDAKPSTGRFGWEVRDGSLLGAFLLQKPPYKPGKLNAVQLRVTQHKANFSAKHKRDLATKGFAFGNHSLLKKAGENFILQELGPAR